MKGVTTRQPTTTGSQPAKSNSLQRPKPGLVVACFLGKSLNLHSIGLADVVLQGQKEHVKSLKLSTKGRPTRPREARLLGAEGGVPLVAGKRAVSSALLYNG